MKKKADSASKSVGKISKTAAKGSRSKKSMAKNKESICLCSLARRVSRLFTNSYNKAFIEKSSSRKDGKYETADISIAQDGTMEEKPRDDKFRCIINVSQFTLLKAIKSNNDENKPFSQKDLADNLRIDNTTLCRNIGVLIGNGWVYKSKKDRTVKLTQCGARVLAEAERSWQVTQNAIKEKLREHDIKPEDFAELLQIVCEAF